jgi:hypothetical protein
LASDLSKWALPEPVELQTAAISTKMTIRENDNEISNENNNSAFALRNMGLGYTAVIAGNE